jgi:hypothetical protein
MDGLKDGVDDAVNAVTNSANAAIGSLPSLVLQRALPGVYDMFQEYKLATLTLIVKIVSVNVVSVNVVNVNVVRVFFIFFSF